MVGNDITNNLFYRSFATRKCRGQIRFLFWTLPSPLDLMCFFLPSPAPPLPAPSNPPCPSLFQTVLQFLAFITILTIPIYPHCWVISSLSRTFFLLLSLHFSYSLSNDRFAFLAFLPLLSTTLFYLPLPPCISLFIFRTSPFYSTALLFPSIFL